MAPRLRLVSLPSGEDMTSSSSSSSHEQHRPLLAGGGSGCLAGENAVQESVTGSSNHNNDTSNRVCRKPPPQHGGGGGGGGGCYADSSDTAPSSSGSTSSSSSSSSASSSSSLSSSCCTAQPQQQQLPLDVEIAREWHDYFNIGALLFVIAATVVNWDLRKLAAGYGPGESYKAENFYWMWATTALYFMADLVWVVVVPTCVKSPNVIITHHLIAVAYMSAPIAWPEYRWFMGACMTVEINTWFLIVRRILYKNRQERLWRFPVVECVVLWFVSSAFYISWILIRIFIYPAILFAFLNLAYKTVLETQIMWHLPMMFIPVHFFLCILNLKWSYDLFWPMIKKWVASDSNNEVGISSGL